MQLTGQTSTQDLSFTPMQGSAMMNGMDPPQGLLAVYGAKHERATRPRPRT
jgi:hypothetical protein